MTPKRKLVLKVDDDEDIISSYKTPSMKKVDEDRNKVIPNYVREAIQAAFQKKLNNFFPAKEAELARQETAPTAPELQAVTESQQPAQPVQQEPVQEELPEELSQDLPDLKTVEKLIGVAAVNISKELRANCIVTIEKGDSDTSELGFDNVKLAIFKKTRKEAHKSGYQRAVSYNTRAKKQVGSVLPIKDLLVEAVNKKHVGKGDKIIVIGDGSIWTWLKGFFFIFDVDNVFFNISTHHLTDKVSADIMEAIITIAQEIGTEGHEGRHIGTAFIVGKRDELMKHTKQLNKINPFANLPEESRKITDPELRETVKNFAQLDGVFLIDDTGTIMTAGAYINIDQNNMELPALQGFGTRHRCAAAITKLTDSIAIVVSASGGTIRIFRNGAPVLKMP